MASYNLGINIDSIFDDQSHSCHQETNQPSIDNFSSEKPRPSQYSDPYKYFVELDTRLAREVKLDKQKQ